MNHTRLVRRGALFAAAALVGAGGLAGEAILISTAGLSLGFGRAGPWGIALFVAGYGLGSYSAGRSRVDPRRWLLGVGLLAGIVLWAGVRSMLAGSAAGWSSWVAGALACWALAVAGWVQGALLPALLRVDPPLAEGRGIAAILAANLAGSIVGAHAIGFLWVAHSGRASAALVAGAATALGAWIAAAAMGAHAPVDADGPESEPEPSEPLGSIATAALAGLGTAWMIALQWIGLRHALLWLESQQATLNAVLTASLTSLTLGAGLAALLPRGRGSLVAILTLAAGGTAWIALGAPQAAELAGDSRYGFALCLLGPALVPLGAWLPALYRARSGEVGARLGGIVVQESWGAILGAPLAHALLVPRAGLGGTLAVLAALGIPLAWVAAGKLRRLRLASCVATVAIVACAIVLARVPEPALRSPLYVDPALTVREFAEDQQFAVGVVDDGLQGERTLLTDRFRAAGTGRDYLYMRALGHLPLLLHPAPRRVAVMCLGTGTTLGAAYLHPEVTHLDVLEISPAVVAAAPWFTSVNQGALDPAAGERVHVLLGDGRRLLADSPGLYDVVTMEPLLPDSPFGVYLYTREFYVAAARALAPGGLVCQWVPPHALEPSVFEAVVESFSSSFAWSGRFLFGSQLVLVGGEREPVLDAGRFPEPGSVLGRALVQVNLHQPGGVISTFRGAAPWPAAPRALSDDAPWIVFEEKPVDARVFGWLGANLARIEQLAQAPSASWIDAAGPGAPRFLRAADLLVAARIEAAEFEARLRRGLGAPADLLAQSQAFEELASCTEAGQLGRALLDEQRFLSHLRQGVALLARDPRTAADHLLSAAELRPERADAHVYVAAVLQLLGNQRGSSAALARAIELCPRILETPAGVRAQTLGLTPAQ